MLDFKNTQLGGSICFLLAASSLGAALPQHQARYVNTTATLNQTQSVTLGATHSDAYFEHSGSKYKAPMSMTENAFSRDLKWQPVMDFDTDSCYNSAAINKYGDAADGLDVSSSDMVLGGSARTKDCRSKADLVNTNAYVRRRCNRGVCAYLYGYYFSKDVGTLTGHRHDWEHVIVWTMADKGTYKNEQIKHIGVSAHGDWDIKEAAATQMQGTHPKVVYHLGRVFGVFNPGSTHSMRFAYKGENKAENHSGSWFRSPLLSWKATPVFILNILNNHSFGHAHLALIDADFTRQLVKTMPRWARERGFDCAHDEPGVDYEF